MSNTQLRFFTKCGAILLMLSLPIDSQGQQTQNCNTTSLPIEFDSAELIHAHGYSEEYAAGLVKSTCEYKINNPDAKLIPEDKRSDCAECEEGGRCQQRILLDGFNNDVEMAWIGCARNFNPAGIYPDSYNFTCSALCSVKGSLKIKCERCPIQIPGLDLDC